MRPLLARLDNERGQTLVEYALILLLISIALVASLGLVAGALDAFYSTASDMFG